MSSLQKGLLVTAAHLAIVLTVAGKYAMDRNTLPRVWALVTPYDPNLPIRGRYVRLAVHAQQGFRATDERPAYSPFYLVTLSTEGGKLIATPATQDGLYARPEGSSSVVLNDPIAFFLPEHVPDPSIQATGTELWAEVSIPKKGPPRPVRLGIKKDGVLTPLNLN